MNFSRAKTYLIFLLIFVNLFLLSVIFKDESEKKLSQKSIENTVNILNKRNISIDNKLISIKNKNLFYLNLSNPFIGEENIKKSFKITTNEDQTFILTPSEKINIEIKTLMPSQETAKKILSFIKEKGINTKYFVWDGTLETEDNTYRASFNQVYEGNKIYSAGIYVFFNKNSIIRIEGKYYNIDSVSSLEKNLKSSEEILIRFSDLNFPQKTVINNFEMGYYTQNAQENYKNLPAIPCYKISILNGNEFYFDATNGELCDFVKF